MATLGVSVIYDKFMPRILEALSLGAAKHANVLGQRVSLSLPLSLSVCFPNWKLQAAPQAIEFMRPKKASRWIPVSCL